MNDQPYGTAQRQDGRPAFAVADIGIDDRDLRVEIFALCDGATEHDGRLSLLGTYDVIHVSHFPVLLPLVTVVLRLRFWPQESRMHRFRFVLTAPDGATLADSLDVTGQLRSVCEERSAACNLITQFPNVRIERQGEYSFDFYLDGRLEARLPFCICPRGILL